MPPLRAYTARAHKLEEVLAFCTGGWRRVDAIAVAVGRKASTVRNEYLRPLVNKGRLELLHPDNPATSSSPTAHEDQTRSSRFPRAS